MLGNHASWSPRTRRILIITVTQNKVLVQFDVLINTNGQLCVRAEYELLYARLCNAASVHMYIVIAGVVLTGQPGSGTCPTVPRQSPESDTFVHVTREVLLRSVRAASVHGQRAGGRLLHQLWPGIRLRRKWCPNVSDCRGQLSDPYGRSRERLEYSVIPSSSCYLPPRIHRALKSSSRRRIPGSTS